jgi:carboxypeptidase-like protein
MWVLSPIQKRVQAGSAMKLLCFLGFAASASAIISPIHAQGSVLVGRVFSDSGMVLIGAEVVLNGPRNLQRTNEKGEFRFAAVPSGFQIVGVRMLGYAPKVDTVEMADAGEVRREYKLSRIETTLPSVPVTATILDRKLYEFHDRRKYGMGRFLDSAEFAKAAGTRTSDKLSKLPGLMIVRGRGMSAYVTTSRSLANSRNRMCTSNVWLDYINLGPGFNVNELDPSIIAAVEWYASTSAVPARFAVPAKPNAPYCGTLVIWLR